MTRANILRVAAALLLTASAGVVAAQSTVTVSASVLARARAEGRIGERYDGYLGAPGPVDDAVERQMGTVNIKRRALFGELAAKRGATRQDVGLVAGCQMLGSIEVGEVYLLQDGHWRQRRAGEAAPRPGYCG